MAITEKDVHGAADALLLEGERPTIERVRLKLGRGSPNTITGFLNTWFAQLGSRIAEQGRADVPGPVAEAVSQLWHAALATARQQLDAERTREDQQLAARRQELAARAQQLDHNEARLAAREADLEVSLAALREQLAETRAEAQRRAEQLVAAEDRMRAAQALAETAHREGAALRTQLLDLQTQHGAALAERDARHAAQERRWLTEIDGERQASKRLQAELDRVRKDAERDRMASHAANETLQAELRQARQDDAVRQVEQASVQARLETQDAANRAAAAAASKRESELLQRLQDLAAQLAIKEKEVEQLMVKPTPKGGGRGESRRSATATAARSTSTEDN
jgi:hypothetical protein